jgi:cytidine deaminase
MNQAHLLARPIQTSEDCSAGQVAAIIVSISGKHYSGICVDFACGKGLCAEQAAASAMLKSHDQRSNSSSRSITTAKSSHPAAAAGR